MNSVVPAVIPTSRHHLDAMLELFGSFAHEVQVDIVDGVFVPDAPPSWPYANGMEPATSLENFKFDTLSVELDLMIANPEETLDMWLKTGVSRIIVHVESTEQLADVLAHRASYGYLLGLAFNNDTDLTLLERIDLSHVDYIQLMGIARIGVQGQPLDERVIERIQYVRKIYPELLITIDGGVTHDTIPSLRKAGATRFVSGSAIVNHRHPAHAYEELVRVARGV
jgi:ribulose-phosphate 3-epimerase